IWGTVTDLRLRASSNLSRSVAVSFATSVLLGAPLMRLIVSSLSKRYRSGVRALSDFSLELGPGVHGFLGPNGAGKSTLMRILATVIRPSAGSVRWNDVDVLKHPDELRAQLGYLPQDFGVYPNLNPVEFLSYLAAAKGMDTGAARKRIDALLELVN